VSAAGGEAGRTGTSTGPRIAVFVSPHGFGHAARSSAVMAEAHRRSGATFDLFTTVPEWFFGESIAGGFRYHDVVVDVGFRQRSALEFDLPATVAALREHLPFDDRGCAGSRGRCGRPDVQPSYATSRRSEWPSRKRLDSPSSWSRTSPGRGSMSRCSPKLAPGGSGAYLTQSDPPRREEGSENGPPHGSRSRSSHLLWERHPGVGGRR
jgi:hypothetical protein